MPKISKIETIPYRLPLRNPLRWGSHSHMDVLEHVLVRLELDSGHSGWAEAPPRPTIYGETVASIQAIIAQHLAPAVLGLEATAHRAFNNHLETIAHNNTAKGALDMALHHALAAWQGESLLAYFNPPQQRVKVAYILGLGEPEAMLAEARRVYEAGVRVLKVKVGRHPKQDEAVLQALQTEFEGTDLSFYADANQALEPETAQRLLLGWAKLGVQYVEEPLSVRRLMKRAGLRAISPIPLIADDSVFSLEDLRRELLFNTFDVLNIKTPRTGFYQSQTMLSLAEQYGKGVMVGSHASSSWGTAQAAIFAGLQGVTHPSELSFFLNLAEEIVTQPLQLTDGYLDLAQLETLQIDEARLQACRIGEVVTSTLEA